MFRTQEALGQEGIAHRLKSTAALGRAAAQSRGDALLFKGMEGTAAGSVQHQELTPALFPATFCHASRRRMLRFPKTGRPVPSGLASDSPDTYWESKLCHLPVSPYPLRSVPLGRPWASTSSLLECWLKWKGSALQAIPVALFLFNPPRDGIQ